MQLASHNGLRAFHLLRAVFFIYLCLSIYRLNLTSQQIPIWVANTHFPFFEENVLFIAKNIFQTKHRSQTIFPIPVFSFCLSHTFITLVVIDILILYYSFLFHYAIFNEHVLVVLRQLGLRFRNIHLRAKRNPRIAVQTFILDQMALFSARKAPFSSERILQCQH